jgi:hypothetical protein
VWNGFVSDPLLTRLLTNPVADSNPPGVRGQQDQPGGGHQRLPVQPRRSQRATRSTCRSPTPSPISSPRRSTPSPLPADRPEAISRLGGHPTPVPADCYRQQAPHNPRPQPRRSISPNADSGGARSGERTQRRLICRCSDRGSPNDASAPFSKRVMALIRLPVSVRTYMPIPWLMPLGARR